VSYPPIDSPAPAGAYPDRRTQPRIKATTVPVRERLF
jgi:hypothetical protein